MNKRYAVLVIVILLIVGVVYYLEKTKKEPVQAPDKEATGKPSNEEKTADSEEIGLKESLYQKAPELTGISGYLNTEEGITIEELNKQGKVVLIDFWTYSCINCIRTFPYLKSWHEKYKDMGLVIIGVHTPEFTFEEEYENVRNAIEKYDIRYPVVQDNDYATWLAFKNRYWPRKYLIDSEGYIRYDHIGEGAYEETEEKIQELLNEMGMDVKDVEITGDGGVTSVISQTPELYAGHEFALPRFQNIGNENRLQPGKTINYTIPSEILSNKIYLDGEWKSNPDDLQLTGEDGLILLKFSAGSVNIVADTLSEPLRAEVLVDGNYLRKEQAGKDIEFEGDVSFANIYNPQLYNIIDGVYGDYELRLKVKRDFSFNAFTFGA